MAKKQPLTATNPYLQNPKIRALMIEKSARTSTKIEGVTIPSTVTNKQSRTAQK